MEEKEKRTSKEEEGSGYGLTADSDHCELTTDDRTPFSENAETRRLQNAFGEALGDLPLPDEVREEWTTFLQRQAQQKRKLYLRICLSGGVAAAIALLLLLWSPWHITGKDGIQQNIEIFTALHAPEQITTIEENGRIIVSTPPATISSTGESKISAQPESRTSKKRLKNFRYIKTAPGSQKSPAPDRSPPS